MHIATRIPVLFAALIAGVLGLAAGLWLAPSPPSPAPPLPPPSPPELPASGFRDFLDLRFADNRYDCDFASALHRAICINHQTAIADSRLLRNFDTASGIYRNSRGALRDALFAIRSMNFVNEQISSGRYAFLYEQGVLTPPSMDPETCLNEGYGICGNHANVLREMLKLAGLEAHTVEFYGAGAEGDYSHIAVEVRIGERWAYLDPTWNAFFELDGRIASVADIREAGLAAVTLHQDETDYRYLVNRDLFDVWTHLEPGVDTIYGQDQGTIRIGPDRLQDGTIDLADIPKYVGDPVADGPFSGVLYALETPALDRLSIAVSGIGDCTAEGDLICVNDDCRPVQAHPYTFHDIPAKSRIAIRSDTQLCYVVFERIEYGSAG